MVRTADTENRSVFGHGGEPSGRRGVVRKGAGAPQAGREYGAPGRHIWGTGPSGLTVDEGNMAAARYRQRIRTTTMSFGTVVVMLALIAAMTAVLIYYITLQADVKKTSQEIADLEQQLTEIKAENDAAYNEITDSISLEDVREKAIHELGMKYANRDQVVIYSGAEEDTVHQVTEIGGRP